MLHTYIKYFFIILCSFSLYEKLLYIQNSKDYRRFRILSSGVLALIMLSAKQLFSFVSIAITVTLFITSVILQYRYSYNVSVVTSVLSFGLSYFGFILSVIIVSPSALFLIWTKFTPESRDIITYIIVGFIQFTLSVTPFRLNRLKKGMPFLQQAKFGNSGTFISILVLLIISILTTGLADDTNMFVCVFIVVALGIFLFLWWYNQLSISYAIAQKQREIAELTNEIQQLQENMNDLKKNNEELTKVIHRDNKLIPAMELAVKELAGIIPSHADGAWSQKADDVMKQLETMAKQRSGLIETYNRHNAFLPKTGNAQIDAILRYLQQRALAEHINFQVSLNCSVNHLIDTVMPQDHLSTLLADLLENALIATKTGNGKNILLCMETLQDQYAIEVYDSGAAFPPFVIRKLGLEQTTSHPDTGGSGIGTMEIIGFARKYAASYVIDETVNASGYTKKVSFLFDGAGQIQIITSRPEVLALAQERPDIIFVRV